MLACSIDTGGGTRSSAILAAQACGPHGHIVVFDLSESMLANAKRKPASTPHPDELEFRTGDIAALPFEDATFDAVLSTYSLCPLDDPVACAMEMWRVLKEGGRMGVAHSTEPARGTARRLARRLEDIAWQLPRVSLWCRPVSVLPARRRNGHHGKAIRRPVVALPRIAEVSLRRDQSSAPGRSTHFL